MGAGTGLYNLILEEEKKKKKKKIQNTFESIFTAYVRSKTLFKSSTDLRKRSLPITRDVILYKRREVLRETLVRVVNGEK